MMGYDGGYYMMHGFGLLGFLLWIVTFIDLILVGIWLSQRILRK